MPQQRGPSYPGPDQQLGIVYVGGPINERVPGTQALSRPPRALANIVADLQHARHERLSSIAFVGGEPSLRSDLPALFRAARRLGLAAGLVTNGRMLVYDKTRLGVCAASFVRITLHAGSASLHDDAVGVDGAFSQTLSGLQSLLETKDFVGRIEVACTLVERNVNHIDEWVDLVASLPRHVVGRLVATWSEPTTVSPLTLARQIDRALCRARERNPDRRWVCEGVPPCMMTGGLQAVDDTLRTTPHVYGAQGSVLAVVTEAPTDRGQRLACEQCGWEQSCAGVPASWSGHDARTGLRPVAAVRSNSFNYEHVRELAGMQVRAGQCQVPLLQLEGSRARYVVLEHEGRVSLFHTPLHDFSEKRLAEIKLGTQQVYFDASPGATLHEFLTNVRRARLHVQCVSCAQRDGCVTAMSLDDGLPFETEERWLRDRVERLRGRVLDVGCGDQLYRSRIGELIERGAIEYLGIDPDSAALERFREAVPAAKLQCVTIEAFDGEPGSFDTVLCLRSVQHFRDLRAAFALIARLLAPGGSAVLCDSPPFAMLRTSAQARAADRTAPVGHEHFRNFTSHQVLDALEGLPLVVLEHRPVSEATSNEWLLELTVAR